MKFIGVVILATFAIILVRGDKEECIGEGALVCFDILRLNVTSEKQKCGVIRSSVECLKGTVKVCHSDERNTGVDVGLVKLEKFLKKHCVEEKVEEKAKDVVSVVPVYEEKCSEEQAKDCRLILTKEFLRDEETCQALQDTVKCLRDAGDECLDNYLVHIKDVKKIFWNHCKPENNDDCPELLTEEFGSFYSPGSTKYYPENTDCWTLIKVDEGKKILLMFQFDWSEQNSYYCDSKYVEILDGENKKSSPVLGQLCSKTFFLSSANTLLVHFHSDGALNHTQRNHEGYVAKYMAVDKRPSPLWDIDNDFLGDYPECVKGNAEIYDCVYNANLEMETFTHVGEHHRDINYWKCRKYNDMGKCFISTARRECDEADWARSKILDVLKTKDELDTCKEHFEE